MQTGQLDLLSAGGVSFSSSIDSLERGCTTNSFLLSPEIFPFKPEPMVVVAAPREVVGDRADRRDASGQPALTLGEESTANSG